MYEISKINLLSAIKVLMVITIIIFTIMISISFIYVFFVFGMEDIRMYSYYDIFEFLTIFFWTALIPAVSIFIIGIIFVLVYNFISKELGWRIKLDLSREEEN